MSKDSYGYAGGDINLYRYAGNDWANATDPSGHFLLATSLVMLSLIAYETMRFTPTIHSHPGGLLAASDPPAKRWDERDIGKIDDVYGNNPLNYFVGEVTRAQYGDAFLASASTGAIYGIAALHAMSIAGAGMSAVSGVSAIARMSLRQILTTQLKKAAVGAAHGYGESTLREDSASDTAWNMAFRGFFGFVDPTNSTYASAGGAAMGAGVGFAIGRDRDSAVLGAFAGDQLGSMAGRGYHGWKYAPKKCSRWVVARRMVGVDVAGSLAGAAIAGYYSDGDLDAIMQGAQMGRMVAGAFASIPSVNRALFNACFAAGTPIRTPDGHKNVEDIKLGDLVLSRDENSPDGIIAAQTVEELFVREAIHWNLTVGGRLIQTTGEHPFFVHEKGWTNAQELVVGDRLLTEEGTWAEVQSIENTETLSIVYNFRVSDYHTYFVGTQAWGFAVWAHNACTIRHLESVVGAGKLKKGEARYAAGLLNKGKTSEFRAYLSKKGIASADINLLAPKKIRGLTARTAEEVNAPFIERGWNPPYKAGTRPREFVTAQDITFVRVHGESNKSRSWMMRSHEIDGLTPAQIKDKFALPDLPTHVSDVHVPAGTSVRVGRVAPQPGWGTGKAVQYELLQRLPESAFNSTRLLP